MPARLGADAARANTNRDEPLDTNRVRSGLISRASPALGLIIVAIGWGLDMAWRALRRTFKPLHNYRSARPDESGRASWRA